MKLNRLAPLGALALAGVLALSGCAVNEASADTASAGTAAPLSGTLNGIGSSAQGTAQQSWIAGIQAANPELTVNYDPQGSGAGRKSFISGAADFAGSDAALSDDELAGSFALCTEGTGTEGTGAIDLPVYISPIAIAYNVDGLTDLIVDAATLAGIFSGKITMWDDPALVSLNPGAALPAERIIVVHRSDDSGTTENFTEYLAAGAADVWGEPASQTFPFQVGDAAKGTSGVAEATKNARNSITYIDESGAAGLSMAQLKVGDEIVKISAEGAAAIVAGSPLVEGRAQNDLAVSIDRTNTQPGAWPLVLVSYLITCQEYQDPATAKLVSAYIQHVVAPQAQQAAAEQAGSAPLSAELAAKVSAAAASIR